MPISPELFSLLSISSLPSWQTCSSGGGDDDTRRYKDTAIWFLKTVIGQPSSLTRTLASHFDITEALWGKEKTWLWQDQWI